LLVSLPWCYDAAPPVLLDAEFTRSTALSDGGRDCTPLAEPDERKKSRAVYSAA
jgi:hypothetical protein